MREGQVEMSSRREVGRGRSCENVSLYSETAKEEHDQTQTEMAHPGYSGENGLKGVKGPQLSLPKVGLVPKGD